MSEGDSIGSAPSQKDLQTSATLLASKQVLRYKRELLRMKSSVTYRLGEHLTDSIRSPWRIPFLPISFPFHTFLLGLEKMGLKSPPIRYNPKHESPQVTNNTTILFPTNGVGFGHFTRMYAVAKALRKADPDMEIIFFTPMPTLHIPYCEGFPTYHVSGAYKFKNMSSSQWNTLIEEQLLMIFEIHKPRFFMFDGAFPYRGMLNAINANPIMKKIWLRRGMFKPGTKIPVDSISFFDLIIHPGDAVPVIENELQHNVEVLHVPPIILVNEEEMMTKENARNRLAIPLDATAWYVQLGAGQINDIESEIRLTIDSILSNDPDAYIVLGESMLGDRIKISHSRVRILRDYPNAIFFKAFDFSVQAGGYNSFHEMRRSGIPTLFYPNMNTGMDDQLARCRIAEDEQWGIVVKKRDETSIQQAIVNLLSISKTPYQSVSNPLSEMIQRLDEYFEI